MVSTKASDGVIFVTPAVTCRASGVFVLGWRSASGLFWRSGVCVLMEHSHPDQILFIEIFHHK